MLRWLVAWFKKYIPITTYSRWAGWDDMRNSISQQLDNMGIDAWMFEWAQKISTQWWVEILHEYLVWWRWFDMNTWDEVYVVVLANANKDILWITYKSREELWTETFYNLENAFEMAETDMTDAIWSMCMSWFSLTLTVSTSAGVTTISDGGQSITINTTSHNMRYNADYYTETSNTSTEYSTISANWWLVDWTYTYDTTDQQASDWNTIISSLKSKGIANATITHDTVNGEITMANGQWSFTIMDKNLWASVVYEDWDTLSEANCGKYYQWGNNYWFAWTGSVTTSSTQVDTTGYGPWNYYTGTDFITKADWSSPSNDDLWGNITNTEYARQWPAPSGYHVPSIIEWQNFIKLFNIIRPDAHSGNDFKNTFKIPFAGIRRYTDSGVVGQGNNGFYWSSSSQSGSYNTYNLMLDSFNVYASSNYYRAYGLPVRPFKNTYTLTPINQLWSTFWNTTAVENEMNSHPYDYYLLWWCTTPLTLASWAWAMRRVYASYDTNTNTWSVMEVS